MAFALFTPYIEAPTVRTKVRDPVNPSTIGTANETYDSGSDTSGFDHLRQGRSIQNDAQRYAGVQPKMGTGDPDHYVEINTFGQSKEFNEEPLFEELLVFDPLVYINNQEALIFPVVLANATLTDPEKFGGFIEPLTIGARASLVSVQLDLEPHDIRAHLQAGNEDAWFKCDQIVQFKDRFKEIVPNDVYIDSSANMGFGSGTITLPGYFPENEKLIEPFNETVTLNRTYESGSLTGTGSLDIENAILAMTGASSDSYVPYGEKSFGTGFTYDNAPDGVDSLAFGGLKR